MQVQKCKNRHSKYRKIRILYLLFPSFVLTFSFFHWQFSQMYLQCLYLRFLYLLCLYLHFPWFLLTFSLICTYIFLCTYNVCTCIFQYFVLAFSYLHFPFCIFVLAMSSTCNVQYLQCPVLTMSSTCNVQYLQCPVLAMSVLAMSLLPVRSTFLVEIVKYKWIKISEHLKSLIWANFKISKNFPLDLLCSESTLNRRFRL